MAKRDPTAFRITNDEGWAIRHLNPAMNDPRLERLHLRIPQRPYRLLDGRCEIVEHYYSDPKLFAEQQRNISSAQMERLQSIHKTLAMSSILWDMRHEAKKELKNAKIAAVNIIGMGWASGKFKKNKKLAQSFMSFKKLQQNRKEQREDLGKQILALKSGETTAVIVKKDESHTIGACIQKVSTNNEACRIAIEFFDGKMEDGNSRTKLVISFSNDVFTKIKGARANGLHALEDFLCSNKRNSERLNQFLKTTGATLHTKEFSGPQRRQNMGNCAVYNPEQALFRAIELDPSLGQAVSQDFQGFLRKKAAAIIQQSLIFTESEKMALQEVHSKLQTSSGSAPYDKTINDAKVKQDPILRSFLHDLRQEFTPEKNNATGRYTFKNFEGRKAFQESDGDDKFIDVLNPNDDKSIEGALKLAAVKSGSKMVSLYGSSAFISNAIRIAAKNGIHLDDRKLSPTMQEKYQLMREQYQLLMNQNSDKRTASQGNRPLSPNYQQVLKNANYSPSRGRNNNALGKILSKVVWR